MELDPLGAERDTADRRRVLPAVTGKAMDLGWTFFEPLIEHVVGTLGGSGDAEVEVIRRFLAESGEASCGCAGRR